MKSSRYLLLYMVCFCAMQVHAQKDLVILHTNDTHSCIMPLNKNLNDTALADRGGYIRRVSLVREKREKDPDLLLLDSGDFSQGSPYYTLFKGDVEVGLMNLMGYDAATIGNHEFDYGLENMARIFRMANFPIVCANYDFSGTELQDIVKPWVIIKRKGLRIGIFGVAPELDGLVSLQNCDPVKYVDPVKTALEVATMLKKEKKCDLVICLSHLGWDIFGVDDVEMIQGSRCIDVVLGGHSHTDFLQLQYRDDLDGKAVPVDQNGKSAIRVGKLTLDFTRSKK